MAGRVAVAASGGRDSTALLHATARLARDSGLAVHALHVHHGLVDTADAWVAHLTRQCARWRHAGLPVTLHVHRLSGSPPTGTSVEAWARQARYAALASMARRLDIDLVLLAHHRRDQAETVLLQALRGGGPAALAAMPAQAVRDGITWARPWLSQPREAVEAYVRRHRLGYVDDDSNADRRFARNRLRAEVWPALVAAFPEAEASLASTARRLHEADVCAGELARLDLVRCLQADGSLSLDAWADWPAARRANLLRHWLAPRCLAGVPDSLVQRLVAQAEATGASNRRWPAPDGSVRLHRRRLQWVPIARRGRFAGTAVGADLRRPGGHRVAGWPGCLEVAATTGAGVPASLLAEAELRPRTGGERFQRAAGTPPRSLKRAYQSAGVPAWCRDGPLVWSGDRLVFVPGLGVDARVLAEGPDALTLAWSPDTSSDDGEHEVAG